MPAIEPHVFMQELRTLGIGDHRTRLFDFLVDCELLTNAAMHA
jgi:hypothetical protein